MNTISVYITNYYQIELFTQGSSLVMMDEFDISRFFKQAGDFCHIFVTAWQNLGVKADNLFGFGKLGIGELIYGSQA